MDALNSPLIESYTRIRSQIPAYSLSSSMRATKSKEEKPFIGVNRSKSMRRSHPKKSK